MLSTKDVDTQVWRERPDGQMAIWYLVPDYQVAIRHRNGDIPAENEAEAAIGWVVWDLDHALLVVGGVSSGVAPG